MTVTKMARHCTCEKLHSASAEPATLLQREGAGSGFVSLHVGTVCRSSYKGQKVNAFHMDSPDLMGSASVFGITCSKML